MNYLSTFLNNINVTLEISALSKCSENWVGKNIISQRSCIYLILDGEGELILNHASYFPKAGDIVFIPFGTHVTYHPINTNYYHKYWCHFQATNNAVNIFDFIHVPLVYHPEDTSEIQDIFEKLTEAYEKGDDFSVLTANGYLSMLIASCLNALKPECITLQNSIPLETINTIEKYIIKNIEKTITLDELASLVHFHPNYFIRFFHKHFNTSPLKYVEQKKIDRAKELLITSDLPINKIAISLGYSSAYHFSNRFKIITGYTPSAWRDLNSSSFSKN